MNHTSKKRDLELTDPQRAALSASMHARALDARQVGFALRGNDAVTDRCLVAEIPGTPAGELSCCGTKDFLIDEIREFTDADGQPVQVRCASSAVLEMTDAPVHVHAATLEYYIILSGSGKMVLGQGDSERIVSVKEGSVVLLPPGQPHGIASDNPVVPIKALLTFSPGLAPVSQPDFRDEAIVHARTSERIKELEGTSM
jgi:mannose-6-phosphate isomerase-like protein (cupin superfamily)